MAWYPDDLSDCPKSQQPSIHVIPPPTATFQIASEELVCVEETDGPFGTKAGSDEVGISITTVAIGLDFSLGDLLINGCKEGENCAKPMRFGDVDNDEKRDMARVLFEGSNLGVLSMAIVGHEVDSEEAYKEMIDDFTEALQLVLQKIWDQIKSHLKDLVEKVIEAAGYSPWGTAIAAAIAIAIIVGIAWWAPPDLLIEDLAAGVDGRTLGELTSLNFPLPSVRTFTSPNDIEVTVEPVDKVPFQYRERRRYRSDDEDSTYEITLRYNRFGGDPA